MKTEQLIHLLASDAGHRARSARFWTAVALAIGFAVSLLLFALILGPRPGALQSATDNAFFDLKFVVVLALALAALAPALVLTRPERRHSGLIWLLLVPPALLAAGIAADLTLFTMDGWRERLVGSNALVCLTAIPLLSLPLLAALLLALRHGATSRPALSGLLAGLVAAGLAAALYASHCTDDSPLFVATWYTIATVPVALVGAALGRRVLRY